MSIKTAGLSSTARIATVKTWVFKAIHVEEATDKRIMWRPWKYTSVEEISPLST
jgi:hypothetical protein